VRAGPAPRAAHRGVPAPPGQLVVELGAGVGNASRLLELPRAVTYFRTDRNPLLLRRRDLHGTPRRYDFDTAPPFRQVDIVFAVNALHCAREPRQTLAYLLEMLREGGLLLLAEGSPRTDASGRPWALDIVFCQFSDGGTAGVPDTSLVAR
jgi:SAM-dependent methyltransferase